jgi:hypothetical protein
MYGISACSVASSGIASPTIWTRYANFNSSLFTSLEIITLYQTTVTTYLLKFKTVEEYLLSITIT